MNGSTSIPSRFGTRLARSLLAIGALALLTVSPVHGATRVRRPANANPDAILSYYEIENIELPAGAPSVDGIAFMPDGRLAVAFYNGWICLYDVKTKKWTTFAEGLHSPEGILPISNREIMVMQMPELTLLVDSTGSGHADRFKTVSDHFGLSGNYAEFAFGPVKDKQGNLFFSLGTGSNQGAPLTSEVRGFFNPLGAWSRMTSPVPYRGWVMEVTPDGKTIPYASGFRESNGLGIDPQGQLYCIDNQGDWVGACGLYKVEKDHFYGHAPDLLWRPDFEGGKMPIDTPTVELDRLRTRQVVTIPYGDMANSATQPLWDTTGGKFGPFGGQIFLGEMNHARLMRIMLEEVDGQTQGAVTPFFDHQSLQLGNNRLAFAPDGSLFVGHTLHNAWTGENGLQRITWKGMDPLEVSAMKLTEDGFDLTFTRPVDPDIAGNVASYAMNTYFYNYHEEYGSDKYDNHQVNLTSAVVSPDHKHVALHLDGLEAWRMYDMTLNGIVSEDGQHPLVDPWVVYTVNHLLHNTPPPRVPLEHAPTNRKTPRFPSNEMKSVGGPQDFKPLPAN